MSYTLHLGDCLEVMRTMPDESVDCVLTDPPYNASRSALKAPGKGKEYRAVNEAWDKDFAPEMYLPEMWRVLKPTGSLIAFSGHRTLKAYLAWSDPRQIIHWRKIDAFPAVAKVYTFSVEYILWYTKGSPYTFHKRFAGRDVIETPFCNAPERTAHPTQKPISVMAKLLSVHSNPGDLVFDPFSGSGTTGVACLKTGRNFVGCEISAEYYAIALKRLEAAAAQPRLFAPETEKTC